MIDQKLRAKVSVGESSIAITRTLNSLAAGLFDFTIDQGATNTLRITWFDEEVIPVDLSAGFTAMLQIRLTGDAATTLLSLTQASGITLAAAEPTITVAITSTQSAALTFTRAVYDLTITQTSGTVVTRLLEGTVTLRKRVSS